MTATYRTIVLHIPATPLGLLAERWKVDHWCNQCHASVGADDLIVHARDHEDAAGGGGGGGGGESLPIPGGVGHNGVRPDHTVIPISTITTEQRRR